MTIAESFAPHLPYVRRYARALTGSQSIGDSYVRAALTAVLCGKFELAAGAPPRVALYRLFHLIWTGAAGHVDNEIPTDAMQPAPNRRLLSLPSTERAALLLTAVEGFSLSDAASILDQTPEEVEQSAAAAQNSIECQLASRLLIIEDEPLIALDLENLALSLGHRVVGIAASKDEAVATARAQQPGLILADINLGKGGSGIEAVIEILQSFQIPVIFVTAYPERLLTGERPEPTYLITKPFLAETVQAVIGQALFFHCVRREAA